MLSFVCPVTGLEVSTGIETDHQSFESLAPQLTEIACPHCNSLHSLAHIKLHLAGDSPAH